MLYDTVDRTSVEKMVRAFYDEVVQDEIVGPYFIKKLGSDLKGGKWYEHLRILDDFWLLMMTGRRGYMGDPFPAHAFIGKLYPETFARWLELFHETVYRFFIPEIADKFYQKAQILADQFMENLDINGEEDED